VDNGIIAGMKTMIVYGIANCDTVQKARTWLTQQGVAFVFHDFKKQGVPTALLHSGLALLGRDTLINRQGLTWRKLDATLRDSVVDDASALALMQSHPSLIKRPVVVWADDAITVGFKPELFAQRLT
jgi:arsenate reductase